MALYICKCGRQVNKSTSADNTGNRDTADCIGCPYLLPWGPNKYVEGRGFRKEIQGYECRMSPTISYTTTYRGQANDKCTLHILSLDLDFLDTVQAWIYDHAADTLTAGFSRGSMRDTDFSDKGRYSLSISCAQNKKGMAAKAALIEQFFTGGRVRKDMTLAPEKAHILAAIQRGKEQAQRKDQPMKKQNDRCPLQQECERTCKVIGHERDCDYYVNNRYSTGGIPDQDEILDDEEATRLEEIEKGSPSDLSLAPSEPVIYQNDYGTLFAVREHNGAPALMCKPLASDAWTLSGVLAAVQGESYTAEDLQQALDDYARAHGWKKEKSESATAPAGAATQSLSDAGSASLAAEAAELPVFDYSGLDDNTAERLKGLAERANMLRSNFVTDMALIVSSAHWYLCGVVAPCDNSKHGNRGDKSFRAWCASIGIGKDTAYRLLNVQTLIDGSTDEELRTIEKAPTKLLYAAAKPSAPAELVQAVKDGDITSHKQYQDLLARYNAERAAREQAEQECNQAIASRDAARDAQVNLSNISDKIAKQRDDALKQRDDANRRAAEAEKQRDGARDALAAAKLRGDKLKAENDALKAQPVEAQVVDEEEVNRRAQARADELTAPLREELEALRARHPADLEEAEQAIRDAYDSALYTGRAIENAWHSLRPLLACMDSERRVMAVRQVEKILTRTQEELRKCL